MALFNGAPAGELALSRGLHYGDGVFRTLLKYDGHLIDSKLQIQKIMSDAAALKLAPPEARLLLDEAATVGARSRHGVIKMLLLRGTGGRGYAPGDGATDRLVLAYPLPAYPVEHWRQGVAAFRCSLQLGRQPALAGIKHLNRLEQVLASRDWPEGAVEGILCDERGAPVCGTRSNLFWVHEGMLLTPPLDGCGVAGLMRDKVLACATALGLPSRLESRPWSRLLKADEAFVTNSLIGIWPLRSLEQRQWTAPGPLTAKLMTVLRHPTLAT
jgi:4-amino-4-deoxychorismate lyase